mgnify:CR=1 FL=1|tara:strand:- start:6321 stop:7502 length:1182 start_codon:yes stop_codon:yes gene_type:complete
MPAPSILMIKLSLRTTIQFRARSFMENKQQNTTYNFTAGPAMLPVEVMQQAQKEFLNWQSEGASVMEISHRSKGFISLMQLARHNIRQLLDIPNNYHVLFMQGGARAQFAAIAHNFLGDNGKALYLTSGYWSEMAAKEAAQFGDVKTRSILDEHSSNKKIIMPDLSQEAQDLRYVHYCPNETLDGLALFENIESPYPLCADMTSCILSRHTPINRYGLIYASSQKNIGAAGFCLVIVREDLLSLPRLPMASVLDYRLAVEYESMYSTPCTYSLYLASLIFEWLLDKGGLDAVQDINHKKADKLYQFIDASPLFHNTIATENRSHTNVTFTTGDAKQDERFYINAAHSGLIGLQGHKMQGGLRASLYNAMPEAGVDALIQFMQEFTETYQSVSN